MKRITDNSYQLKQAVALETTGTTKGGANKPLFITALNQENGRNEEYVLKYRGAERMTEQTSARELIGAFLAQVLDIPVPEPAIIHVTDFFLSQMTDHPDYSKIVKSKGINFGCEKISETIDLIPHQTLSPTYIKQALRIFVFDIIIQNADRNFQKPNMFLSKNKIYVIDHEIAFGFIDTFSFLRSPNPWTFNETDVQSFKKHFFYPQLKNNPLVDLDEAFAPFDKLDDAFWEKLLTFVPNEWITTEIDLIKNHISQAIAHLTELKQEIWTKLLVQ
jgi:hypothetical protein